VLDPRLQRTEIAEDDWVLGPYEAPVTILEYGDFECPFCAAAMPVLDALIGELPREIRLVYRHFPISTAHPHSVIAAESAEAAGAQGKFWEMHHLLFRYQRQLEYEFIRRYADHIDLDLDRFDAEIVQHVHLPEVRRDFRRGVQDGVNGTPTLFLNGHRYDGPRDRASMLAAIAQVMPEQPRAGHRGSMRFRT
jgi:protein-disulfide isomerase